MRVIAVVTAALLAACQAAQPKPNASAPAVISVPVATYVPIDLGLTKRCNWVRDGELSAVFEVSNGRKRCLLQYEAQLDAIGQVQGKPVPVAEP